MFAFLRRNKEKSLLGFLLFLYIESVTAIWEPLLIYDVNSTSSMSPLEAWDYSYARQYFETMSAEDLIRLMDTDTPMVSSRIAEWTTLGPNQLRVRAVGEDLVTLETILINTVGIRTSEFDQWMKAENMVLDGTTADSVDVQTGVGFVFLYNNLAVRSQDSWGMALLWENVAIFNPVRLLLVSRGKPIGSYDDIRFNLRTHVYTSKFPEADVDPRPRQQEERISLTDMKIHFMNRTVRVSPLKIETLVSLRYEMEDGVMISEVTAVCLETPYVINLQTFDGEEETYRIRELSWSMKNSNHLAYRHIEVLNEAGSLITVFSLTILYSYLPYDVANYLVIEGYYPMDSTAAVNITPATSGAVESSVIDQTTTFTNPMTFPFERETAPPDSTTILTDPIPTLIHETTTLIDSTTTPADQIPTLTHQTTTLNDPSTIFANPTSLINPTITFTDSASPSHSSETHNDHGVTSADHSSISIHQTFTLSAQPTTQNTADSSAPSGTTETRCQKECSCRQSNWGNATLDDLEPEVRAEVLRIISELKSTLTVEKISLSMYRAKKISATDTRTTSSSIGAVGIVIIVGLVLVLVVADVTSFFAPKNQDPYRRIKPK